MAGQILIPISAALIQYAKSPAGRALGARITRYLVEQLRSPQGQAFVRTASRHAPQAAVYVAREAGASVPRGVDTVASGFAYFHSGGPAGVPGSDGLDNAGNSVGPDIGGARYDPTPPSPPPPPPPPPPPRRDG